MFDGADVYNLNIVSPPIGLMYLATYLKRIFGKEIDMKIIDRVVDCYSNDDLVSVLKDYNPDIVGLRGIHLTKKVFHEIAATVKGINNHALVIGGGPYAADIKSAISDKNIDFLVMGEGENTFAQIVSRILRGQTITDIQGIAFRDQEKIIRNPSASFIEDLDSLPFPDYSFISFDKYSQFLSYGSYTRRRSGLILTSRGCPYECIFCHNVFGKRFRARSPQNVFEEIRELKENHGINDFFIIDDTFNVNYQRAMDIFDLIISSKMKINLYLATGIRGDIVDHKFVDKMVEAGVVGVAYAIESASRRLQKLVKKFIDLDKLADTIHYTCSKNIMVTYFLMIGFPTEREEEAS